MICLARIYNWWLIGNYNVVESDLVDYYNAEFVRLIDIHAPLVEKNNDKKE